jgi:asparagine synthase (glutamine-hydrolysing)
MCGFAGFISSEYSYNSERILHQMSKTIIPRGPDDYGIWFDQDSKVGLAFRRLAILDLSSAGHQPMTSQSGRYVVAFNGEIYNHLELKHEINLQFGPQSWEGRSDTEILLFLIEKYGLHDTLKKCVGMFAIALWDRESNFLQIARDRFGEKPLYYGWSGSNFLFGSDLSSLKKFPSFQEVICPQALSLYLNYSYVPAPLSIYKDFFKVEPGQIITFKSSEGITQTESVNWFWRLESELSNAKSDMYDSMEDGLTGLKAALQDSINLQMISDVPIGSFLSGGIDSSLITAMMQEQSAAPIKTFTIGFQNQNFDESPYAKSVAAFLGTDHTEVILSEKDALDVIPSIPDIYSEPFADSSQIPTYLVAKIAKSEVTVSLTGDGGDELFGGYNRYFWSQKIWRKVNWMPFAIRKSIGQLLVKSPADLANSIELLINKTSMDGRVTRLNDKVQKLASRLQFISSERSLYSSLCTEWNDTHDLLTPAYQSLNSSQLKLAPLEGLSAIENMMYWDLSSYLKEDILTKVDRAGMANSLETRAPFLDFRVAASAWKFKESFLISGYQGKMPLRKILETYIPKELFDRPKAGFGIPIGIWLRGPLHDWAASLLEESEIIKEGIFNYNTIHKLWHDHLNGNADNTVKLWNVLMFRAWMRKNKSN